MMTIPYAIKEGGWLSFLLLLMFAAICCYTGILLLRCLQSHPGVNSYPDIGQAAFGIAGRLGISVSTTSLTCIVLNCGCSCDYITNLDTTIKYKRMWSMHVVAIVVVMMLRRDL